MAMIGQRDYIVSGTYQFVVPAGVTSICAVAIGGGGGGLDRSAATSNVVGASGQGGGLGWANSIHVEPGETLTVVVGRGGAPAITSGLATNGGDSYISRMGTRLVAGLGGVGGGATNARPTLLGGYIGSGGGVGGEGVYNTTLSGGGGGAGGYLGDGGVGMRTTSTNVAPTVGSGGGSGGVGSFSAEHAGTGGVGGGVGIYGIGEDGVPPLNTDYNTKGGDGSQYDGSGAFGGGGSSSSNGHMASPGQGGAVRIIWGNGRWYPDTNTSNDYVEVDTSVKVSSFISSTVEPNTNSIEILDSISLTSLTSLSSEINSGEYKDGDIDANARISSFSSKSSSLNAESFKIEGTGLSQFKRFSLIGETTEAMTDGVKPTYLTQLVTASVSGKIVPILTSDPSISDGTSVWSTGTHTVIVPDNVVSAYIVAVGAGHHGGGSLSHGQALVYPGETLWIEVDTANTSASGLHNSSRVIGIREGEKQVIIQANTARGNVGGLPWEDPKYIELFYSSRGGSLSNYGGGGAGGYWANANTGLGGSGSNGGRRIDRLRQGASIYRDGYSGHGGGGVGLYGYNGSSGAIQPTDSNTSSFGRGGSGGSNGAAAATPYRCGNPPVGYAYHCVRGGNGGSYGGGGGTSGSGYSNFTGTGAPGGVSIKWQTIEMQGDMTGGTNVSLDLAENSNLDEQVTDKYDSYGESAVSTEIHVPRPGDSFYNSLEGNNHIPAPGDSFHNSLEGSNHSPVPGEFKEALIEYDHEVTIPGEYKDATLEGNDGVIVPTIVNRAEANSLLSSRKVREVEKASFLGDFFDTNHTMKISQFSDSRAEVNTYGNLPIEINEGKAIVNSYGNLPIEINEGRAISNSYGVLQIRSNEAKTAVLFDGEKFSKLINVSPSVPNTWVTSEIFVVEYDYIGFYPLSYDYDCDVIVNGVLQDKTSDQKYFQIRTGDRIQFRTVTSPPNGSKFIAINGDNIINIIWPTKIGNHPDYMDFGVISNTYPSLWYQTAEQEVRGLFPEESESEIFTNNDRFWMSVNGGEPIQRAIVKNGDMVKLILIGSLPEFSPEGQDYKLLFQNEHGIADVGGAIVKSVPVDGFEMRKDIKLDNETYFEINNPFSKAIDAEYDKYVLGIHSVKTEFMHNLIHGILDFTLEPEYFDSNIVYDQHVSYEMVINNTILDFTLEPEYFDSNIVYDQHVSYEMDIDSTIFEISHDGYEFTKHSVQFPSEEQKPLLLGPGKVCATKEHDADLVSSNIFLSLDTKTPLLSKWNMFLSGGFEYEIYKNSVSYHMDAQDWETKPTENLFLTVINNSAMLGNIPKHVVDKISDAIKSGSSSSDYADLQFEKNVSLESHDILAKYDLLDLNATVWYNKIEFDQSQTRIPDFIDHDYLKQDWGQKPYLDLDFDKQDWGQKPYLDLDFDKQDWGQKPHVIHDYLKQVWGLKPSVVAEYDQYVHTIRYYIDAIYGKGKDQSASKLVDTEWTKLTFEPKTEKYDEWEAYKTEGKGYFWYMFFYLYQHNSETFHDNGFVKFEGGYDTFNMDYDASTNINPKPVYNDVQFVEYGKAKYYFIKAEKLDIKGSYFFGERDVVVLPNPRHLVNNEHQFVIFQDPDSFVTLIDELSGWHDVSKAIEYAQSLNLSEDEITLFQYNGKWGFTTEPEAVERDCSLGIPIKKIDKVIFWNH